MSRQPLEVDKEAIHTAYEDVRSDATPTNWIVCGYEGNRVVHKQSGVDYDELPSHLSDDARLYIFLRLVTGDELSKRTKFAFIIWCGPEVSAMNRARMSTEVASVKEVIQNYAVEKNITEKGDFDVEHLRTLLVKAGGAAYGSAS